MKRDKLESYILENRHEFDLPEPGDEMWTGIRHRIRPAPRIGWKKVLFQAAAAVAVFMVSWLVHDAVNKASYQADREETLSEATQLEQRMQELVEADAYYTARITDTREEIYQLSGQDANMMKIVDMDLQELELVFEELKDDLRDDSGNQEVIEAMIQNYRIKLEILQEMLLQMKKSKNPDETPQGYEL